MLPAPEACNLEDDDCDGEADEDFRPEDELLSFPAAGDRREGGATPRQVFEGDGVFATRALALAACEAPSGSIPLARNSLVPPEVRAGCSTELLLTVDGREAGCLEVLPGPVDLPFRFLLDPPGRRPNAGPLPDPRGGGPDGLRLPGAGRRPGQRGLRGQPRPV